MGGLTEQRHEGHPGPSTTTVEARAPAPRVDDWLGEISDDDWSEPAGRRPAPRHDAVHGDVAVPVDDRRSELADDRSPPARAVHADRAVGRRRIVAGLVLATALVVAVGVAVLVGRGGDEAPATSVAEPVATAPEQTETGTSTAPATTAPSDTSTAPTTTPSAPDAASFTLPQGTKLRRGEDADPAVTAALQRALRSAGYDPGPIDGTYGQQTEDAVVAFQQANGLADDGVVGPDTAAALNEALATG